MTNRIEIAGLRVAGELFTFVGDEALPGTGISGGSGWVLPGIGGAVGTGSPAGTGLSIIDMAVSR